MSSKVVHVRNVNEDAREELSRFASQFGTVANIVFLPKFSQALIEMDTNDNASSLITYARNNPPTIRGKEASFSFSKSQTINPASSHPSTPNRVLLCTILNPVFNVNVDVMYTITSPFGIVQRIVIFTKNGIQALVEFSTTQAAQAAKAALDGKDIYPGGCTLRIEYSHTDKLNVTINSDKTRDFTNPTLPTIPVAPAISTTAVGAGGATGAGPLGGNNQTNAAAMAAMMNQMNAAIAAAGQLGIRPDQFNQMMYPMDPNSMSQAQAFMELYRTMLAGGNPSALQTLSASTTSTAPQSQHPSSFSSSHHHHHSYQQHSSPSTFHSTTTTTTSPPSREITNATPVLILYGLSEDFTSEHLFNLLSVFGRVNKVKVLITKHGSAMCQMEDLIQAQNVISALHMQNAFGQQMQVQHSKHPYISDSQRPDTPSNPAKDYTSSALNRYNRNGPEIKPSKNVSYSTQLNCDTQSIRALFKTIGVSDPVSITPGNAIGVIKQENDASFGVIEFKDQTSAIEAIALANNAEINPGQILKLSFVSSN